jgi:hypothetical protein
MGRTANPKLDTYIQAAGFSRAGLALRVNADGAAMGLNLTYGKSAPSQWAAGHVPAAPVRRIVLVLLSTRLGRPVTAEDVGWPPTAAAPDIRTGYPDLSDVFTVLPAAWSAASQRHGDGSGSLALPLPAVLSEYLTAFPDRDLTHHGERRVGVNDVRMISDLCASVRDLDHRYGGGRMASTAAAILRDVATPLLRGSYTDAVGRELWPAVGELATLAGWSAFDAGHDHAARQHFLTALRLGKGADDRLLVGYVLTRMAQQALWHRRGKDAIRYAHAAAAAAGPDLTPRMRTHYLLIQARGHAISGDVVNLRHAAADAQRMFDRGDSAADGRWLAALDYSELHGALAGAYAEAGLGHIGLPHIDIALSERDAETYARPHALAYLTKAELALAAGDVELAGSVAVQAAVLAAPQGSVRLPERFESFTRRFADVVGGEHAHDVGLRVADALQAS